MSIKPYFYPYTRDCEFSWMKASFASGRCFGQFRLILTLILIIRSQNSTNKSQFYAYKYQYLCSLEVRLVFVSIYPNFYPNTIQYGFWPNFNPNIPMNFGLIFILNTIHYGFWPNFHP